MFPDIEVNTFFFFFPLKVYVIFIEYFMTALVPIVIQHHHCRTVRYYSNTLVVTFYIVRKLYELCMRVCHSMTLRWAFL